MTRRDTVQITQSRENMACEVSKVTKGHIDYLTYNHNKLVEIGIKMKKDYRCTVLSPSTVKQDLD